ncbi:hypothetical protein K438DRAFT_1976452 [Mycena galopus ATCC 62051]|nr:hypothetical protein K438DRAFT_1976452 [Mycena galopus ATCC 62051]
MTVEQQVSRHSVRSARAGTHLEVNTETSSKTAAPAPDPDHNNETNARLPPHRHRRTAPIEPAIRRGDTHAHRRRAMPPAVETGRHRQQQALPTLDHHVQQPPPMH